MPKIQLELSQKLWLLAVYGDMPLKRQLALWNQSSFPVQIGSEVLEDGRAFARRMRHLQALWNAPAASPLPPYPSPKRTNVEPS